MYDMGDLVEVARGIPLRSTHLKVGKQSAGPPEMDSFWSGFRNMFLGSMSAHMAQMCFSNGVQHPSHGAHPPAAIPESSKQWSGAALRSCSGGTQASSASAIGHCRPRTECDCAACTECAGGAASQCAYPNCVPQGRPIVHRLSCGCAVCLCCFVRACQGRGACV